MRVCPSLVEWVYSSSIPPIMITQYVRLALLVLSRNMTFDSLVYLICSQEFSYSLTKKSESPFGCIDLIISIWYWYFPFEFTNLILGDPAGSHKNNENHKSSVNPLSTTGRLLTHFLISSYHEYFTYLANHYKALKMWHQKFAQETNFSYSLSDWFNGGVYNLTNRQVVLIGLTSVDIQTDGLLFK